MEFRLLGAFEVWDDGKPVEIAGQKRRALLALLVLRANEVVRSELLVEELWADHPPRNAAAALQTHVSRLRKTLGADTIASREWGYVLQVAPEDIDLRRFENLVAEAEPLAAQQRAAKLAEALALWRGPPLADFVNESALEYDIARLQELRLSTLERRIDADLEAGQSSKLVGELEALIAQHPLREHLRWLLILALYRAERQAEALEVYRETRRVLSEELGIEPSPALRELEQAILRQDPSLDASAALIRTEPIATAPESKRRRAAPLALLALLALGLAGTATAIALFRPANGTSSDSATNAIFESQLLTLILPPPDGPTTNGAKTSLANTGKTHTGGAATTSTNHLSVTQSTTTVGPPPDKRVSSLPLIKRYRHNFGGSNLDTLKWTSWSLGNGSSYTQGNGRLTFSIAGDATFDSQSAVGTYIGTTCRFPGAFDAHVHFHLAQWPDPNSAVISFGAANTGDSEELIERVSRVEGDGYYAWPEGGPTNPNRPVVDIYGRLRITRSHGLVSVYYWQSGRWKELGRTPLSGEVSLRIGLEGGQAGWQGQDVSAAISHFEVRARYIDCSTGPPP